jgi:DNA-binding YbaB/EbfC family protein
MEPGGQLDLQQIFAAAAQMQTQIANAQQQLDETEIEGTAGGGLVTVTINGQGELVDLLISAEAIDPADRDETAQTVADLVLAACRDAYTSLGEVQADLQAGMMGPLAGGLGDLGDLGGGEGMPGIPGLPGFPSLPGAGAGPGVPGQGGPGQGGAVQGEPGQGEPGHGGLGQGEH